MPEQVGSPVRFYQKWAFVLEIEGVAVAGFQDCGPLKQTAGLIEQHEGGARTAVDYSTSKFKTEKVAASRGASDNDELWQWWVNVKKGNVDKRNCSVVQQDPAGNPILRWNLPTCSLLSYEGGTFDGKNETENVIEKIEFQPLDLDRKTV